MKTELIYSKNKYEDIENAIVEIDRFRAQYVSMFESGDYRFLDVFISGLIVCLGFLGIRLHILPLYVFLFGGVLMFFYSLMSKRGIIGAIRQNAIKNEMGALMQKDKELKDLIEELNEIKNYVEISNVLQETYARYHGSLDIKVEEKHNPSGATYFEMSIVTHGYSDDLGKSGSIKIPGRNRTIKLTPTAMDKIFSRGIIDFSWLDGNLYDCAQKASDLHADMSAFAPKGQKRLPLKDDLPKAEFQKSGNNPRDILD